MSTETKIPQHIAIIMDGNGRWAKQRGKDRSEGHFAGMMALRETVKNAAKAGVKWLTVYAKRGHVFLVIAGMRFDTTGTSRGVGPRWYTESRPCGGFYVRHIPGF